VTPSTPEGRNVSCYISLGSNQGDRYAQIQNVVFSLDVLSVGKVTCSSLFLNPAWGFQGPDFLNAVVGFETRKDIGEIWEHLRGLEVALGKKARMGDTFSSRPIDIDILFYGDARIQTDELTVPHPRYRERRFVLEPMAEIAGEFRDPASGQSIRESLEQTRDESWIRRYPLRLYNRPEDVLLDLNGLAVEGNIGVGKTTLASALSERLGLPLVLERFGNNPFLPSYYEDPGRYAFPVEMYFLYDRVQHWREVDRELGHAYVSDYHVQKSQVFARNSLTPPEYRLFEDYFYSLTSHLRPPQLLLFLQAPEEQLLEQIGRRGRSYEQSIPREYLKSIQDTYLELLPKFRTGLNLRLNRNPLDFIGNPGDIDELIRWLALEIIEWRSATVSTAREDEGRIDGEGEQGRAD